MQGRGDGVVFKRTWLSALCSLSCCVVLCCAVLCCGVLLYGPRCGAQRTQKVIKTHSAEKSDLSKILSFKPQVDQTVASPTARESAFLKFAFPLIQLKGDRQTERAGREREREREREKDSERGCDQEKKKRHFKKLKKKKKSLQ